jgi:Cu-processing system permease protein
MTSIAAIALNTFREARRNRIFYSTLFFAVGLILFSVLFTEVTFVAHDRILRNVGFATMNLFGVGIAIFLGVGMVNREIEKRTIYTVISKPLARWAFIVGKYAGLLLTLAVTVGLMFLGFAFTLLTYGSPFELALFVPVAGLLLELSVIVAFAIFCSTWTTSTMSALFTASFFVVGHLVRDIRFFGSRSESPTIRALAEVTYSALPDLERFNFKEQVAYLELPPISELLWAFVYGGLWTALFLVAASLVFARRDFR